MSLSFNAYFVRHDIGGGVLWNAKEVYFFIGSDTRGYQVKWAGYPLLFAGEMLGHIELPDDDRGVMYIMRITSAGLERHVLELPDRRPGSVPQCSHLWMAEFGRTGQRLAASAGGRAITSSRQLRKSGEDSMASTTGRTGPLGTRAGWSKDGVWAGHAPTIRVGDEFELRVLKRGGSLGYGTIAIEMRKQRGEPRTMFTIDGSAGRVSRSDYWHAFHDR